MNPIHFTSGFYKYYLILTMVLQISVSAVSAKNTAAIYLTFKDSTIVSDSVFTVKDIAVVQSKNSITAKRVMEQKAGICAPPGYTRFVSSEKIIDFELKHQFPHCTFIGNGAGRISVKSAYEEYTVEQFIDSLHNYLRSKIRWKTSCWTVAVRNSKETFRCGNMPFQYYFEGLKNEYPKGNCAVKMIIRQGTVTYRVPIYCTFNVSLPVLVTRRAVSRHEPLSSSNCEIVTKNISSFAPEPLTLFSQITDTRAARTLKPGTILQSRHIKKIPVVEKNEEVAITVNRGRIRLSVPGIARESGGIGERIWVKNRKSNKLIRVQVIKKGIVTVEQGGRSI
jgi:flagella basal body P-ring formation protein FlgA